MRALAHVWTTPQIVQPAVAQLPWSHFVTLLHKLKEPGTRNWYAAQSPSTAGRATCLPCRSIPTLIRVPSDRKGRSAANEGFTEACSGGIFVQQAAAQLPWLRPQKIHFTAYTAAE
jgi:hypothetical protein